MHDGPVQDGVTRVVYDLGTEASFKVSREWDNVHNDWFRVDGLRHIIQPFADYQWVPRPNQLTNDLFQFDSVRNVTLRGGDSLSVTRYSPAPLAGAINHGTWPARRCASRFSPSRPKRCSARATGR